MKILMSKKGQLQWLVGALLPKGLVPLIILALGAVIFIYPALAFQLFTNKWIIPLVLGIVALKFLRG